MSGAMLHGLGDCTPDRNCGCIGAGDGHRVAVAAHHARCPDDHHNRKDHPMNTTHQPQQPPTRDPAYALAGSEADTSDVDVCSGDADCTSALHVHGCFADTTGPCTDPDEHQPTAGSGWVE